MSSSQPPQRPHVGPPGWQPPGPAHPASERRSRTGLILGSAGAAIAVLVAGGAVLAFTVLSGGGPQPAAALPDSTVAYARIDLDPSASQKVDFLRLLRRVPEFSEATGIDGDRDDLRRVLFTKALAGSSCDVDYADDVEPWIGDRAAVAAVPVDGRPVPVFVLQVGDRNAAKKGIDALAGCGDGQEIGSAFVDDYLVVTEKQHTADAVVSQATDSPLSERESFTADMDALGDQGVASFWADGDGLAGLAGEMGGTSGPAPAVDPGFTSAAGALRAGGDYLELAGVTRSASALETAARTDVADLPESTVFAASFAGGADDVDRAWAAFSDAMGDTTSGFRRELDAFEQSTGLSLPADLETIVGDDITLAVDERGLDAITRMTGPADLGRLGVGVRITTAKSEINGVLDRVNAKLTATGTPAMASKETDDGLVVATSDEYAEELAEGGSLGGSDAFRTVVPDADDAVVVTYLNVDKVTEVAKQIARQAGESTEEIDMLDPIEAVGFSTSNADDERNTSVLRVAFD